MPMSLPRAEVFTLLKKLPFLTISPMTDFYCPPETQCFAGDEIDFM
jgi:hypothetical protein